jgi:SLOG family YspA-like protein
MGHLYPRRVIVAVARGWTDEELVGRVLAKLWHDDPETVLVHGANPRRDSDAMARRLWLDWGLKEDPHPADWTRHGKAAGPIRNREMLAAGADEVIVFLTAGSRGARDLADEAERRGIKVTRYRQ